VSALVNRNDLYTATLTFPDEFLVEGDHWITGQGAVGFLEVEDTRVDINIPIGLFMDGYLTFDEIDTGPDGIVTGSCSADLYSFLDPPAGSEERFGYENRNAWIRLGMGTPPFGWPYFASSRSISPLRSAGVVLGP